MSPPDIDPDGDDALRRQKRAARAARFNNDLPGNRYKELEELRGKERAAFVRQGLITSGKTQLDAAVDLRGSCEGMCTEYEMEFREFTREIHPFESTPDRRMDHSKAVAAYTRSDAGAGHGEAAILPSDLRSPQALVRSLDYLINVILPMQPPPNPNAVHPPPPTSRRALGYTAGFIRDRTRAIRKEFAIQSSWGHEEAIACFERIARWHILCLRELQEETGSNTDMHIDSAELGRAFTSLRQHYNDRREESGLDMPCPNEPEFRAYMLIFDLTSKSVSIPISELPSVILDHPLVQIAWQFRQAAQRNFDSQKEGSKQNAELGANFITRFVRLLKQRQVPFLFSCLVEVRLREMRRSAIRALTRTYPRLKQDPIRLSETGEVLERRMILIPTLNTIIGAELQEEEGPAWDDIVPVSTKADDESVAVVERFNLDVYHDQNGPVGALINLGAPYNDNKDAPFTRRWKFITDKRASIPYADIVNGKAGVYIDGKGAAAPVTPSEWKPPAVVKPPQQFAPSFTASKPIAPHSNGLPAQGAFSNGAFANGTSAFGPGAGNSAGAFGPVASKSTGSAFGPPAPASAFSASSTFTKPAVISTPPTTPQTVPSFFAPKASTTPTVTPSTPSALTFAPPKPAETQIRESSKKRVSFFDTPAQAGPSKTTTTTPSGPPPAVPSFFPSSAEIAKKTASVPTPSPVPSPRPPSPKKESRDFGPPEPPKMKVARELMRIAPGRLQAELVNEVVQQMIKSAEPHFRRTIQQLEYAHEYRHFKDQRQRELKRFARLTAKALLDEHIAVVAGRVFDHEQRVRELVRKIALHWRSWTSQQQEIRAALQRERDANYARLRGMGLGRSLANFEETPSERDPLMLPSLSSAASFTSFATSTAIDETEVMMELHETERTRDRLWEQSSFLRTLASHVSRLVSPTEDDPRPVWETVILTAEHSGSGVGQDARDWLADKFLPSNGKSLHHKNVTFRASIDDVRGDIPGSADTGLVVFEAPLETINSSQAALNADDAADRLEAMSGRFQQGGRYRSALLILTWTDEEQEDVVARLQIAHHVSEFSSVRVLSLEDADDLDERFAWVLRELIPSDPRLTQVSLHLSAVIASLEPSWLNLLHLARRVQQQFPESPQLAADIASLAITPLHRIPAAISDALEDLPMSDQSTYDPPQLPQLVISKQDRSNDQSVASTVAAFLSEPGVANIGAVALVRGPLRQAATNGTPLPIVSVLEALGSYVFNTLSTQTLRLNQWTPPPHPAHAAATLSKNIRTTIEVEIASAVRGIARAGREAELAAAAATPLPLTPTSSGRTTPPSKPKGTKRGIDETFTPPETKASKSARLLRVLADAQATLNKIERMDEAGVIV